ncbi:hypothetical protein OSTOST_25551 [Ostertagia ostertagi]
MVHRPQSLSSKDGFGCRDRSRSVAPRTYCRSHRHYPSSLRKRTIAAPWCTLSTMSTLRGHKARITIAQFDADQYRDDTADAAPYDSTSKRSEFCCQTRAIENASGLLRVRYDALLSFVRIQENCEELQQEVDRFWNDQQGEKLLEDAQILITAVDAQLLMDESLENILSQQPSDEVVTATAALTISDTSSPQEDQQASEHHNPNQDALPLMPNQDVPSSMLQPIQLRRLELPTFDGDVTKFYDFWCRFKTAVHDNTNLSLSTKFIYLTNSLKGSAALIVQGYDPSKPENYQLAVQALRRRYDRPKFTHNLFHQRLEQLPASSHSASVQRDTLSQIQSFILQLNRYEDTTTSLALMKTILKKFPRETQLEVHKLEHRSGKTWTLPELIDGLNEVIEELEKLEDCTISTSGSQLTTNTVSVNSSRSPTPEPRYDPSMCCFCNSYNHTSTRCHRYIPPANRRIIVSSLNLCWKCFKPGHPSRLCSRGPCSRCGGEHHHLVCTYDVRRNRLTEMNRRRYRRESSDSTSRSHSRGRHHRRSSSHGRRASDPPLVEVLLQRIRVLRDSTLLHAARHHIEGERPNIARSVSGHQYVMIAYRNAVLLQEIGHNVKNPRLMTVEALAVNPQANSTMSVTLLLDTGAQRSFVLQDTINKLQVAVSETVPLTTVTFGGIRTTEHSGIADVTLIDQQNKKLQLVLRTKDKITIPCSPTSLGSPTTQIPPLTEKKTHKYFNVSKTQSKKSMDTSMCNSHGENPILG